MGKKEKSQRRNLIVGTLRCTRKGFCFVVPDVKTNPPAQDILVRESGLGSALHGDKVAVYIVSYHKGKPEGRIDKVLQRTNQTVVGHFVQSRRAQHVTPIEEKFLYDIEIPPAETMSAQDGQIVVVDITRFPIAGRPPVGRVIEVLGFPEDPGIDIEIVIRKHHLPHVFPAEVIEFAEGIPSEVSHSECVRRLDLRDVPTVTIDGETARDFDDAISLRETDNGHFHLGVHIADVSHYVTEENALDVEAFRRGTSVYFPERAIPMLPERLSNGICSLNPQVDRLTMSAQIEMNASGKVIDYRLAETVINSNERMTYTNVNRIVTDGDPAMLERYSPLVPMFQTMLKLARILIAKRQKRGALDFDLPEAVVQFNDEGKICGIVRSERNIAHRIIEEFMLLANEVVATHLNRLNVPSLYRIHDEPDPKKLGEFADLAAGFGFRFNFRGGKTSPKDFQDFTKQIADTPESKFLSYLMLRSLPQARYSPEATGHFGLATKLYTHFTSPIRRYPDLIVHRILREVLQFAHEENREAKIDWGKRDAITGAEFVPLPDERIEGLEGSLEGIASQSSERERAADQAERELLNWKKAEFMTDHVGETFEGIITGVKEYGIYVELNDLFIEGLVHISTLVDDYYVFKEKTHSLIGQRGRSFRLGDEVKVLVDRVDENRHLIDFSIVDVRPIRRVGKRNRKQR